MNIKRVLDFINYNLPYFDKNILKLAFEMFNYLLLLYNNGILLLLHNALYIVIV